MRRSLSVLCAQARPAWSWNFGLAYERLLMFRGDELGDTGAKNEWLEQLESTAIAADYAEFFRRWRSSLDQGGARARACRAASRVLVGHGNPSGSEVGLSVHHTWGVPVIPGSALAGLLAHHVARHYGARPGEQDPEREQWRGVSWDERRIVRGPGELYRRLFGAPDADSDQAAGLGACAGVVTFHDALYVPKASEGADRPFARDVLTVHHKRYYDSRGETPPNDHDSPNPVGFLTVRPGAEFLLALGGPEEWTELAMSLLLEALDEWGVGGKTSLGYGRLLPTDEHEARPSRGADEPDEAPASTRAGPSELLVEFEAALKTGPGSVREVLARVVAAWPERLLELDDKERRRAATKIQRKLKPLTKARDEALLGQLRAWIAQLRGEQAPSSTR